MQQQQAAPLFNSVTDACRRLGVGRTTLYELIAGKAIVPIKLGTRTLVPESELQRFAANRMEAGT